MNTYTRLPVTFVKGKGVWLWDDQDKVYLDALAGIAVCGLRHCHPKLVKAISEQAATLIHTSNLYHIDKQQKLAHKLAVLSDMDKAFFCNSGAEANEAAIKLARLYGHNKGINLPTIIVMEQSFHGRTMATLTATDSRKVRAGFEPLLPGFVRVPFNDLEAIEQVAIQNKNIVAILVEPYQGEGGINVPPVSYLKKLRTICNENDWLLMLDEVQCGIGRSGKWFAFQHSEIVPDVMTLAKGLGSGFPIGACLAGNMAGEIFKPGSHASTFGGNPLACAAAIATLDVIEEDNLMKNALEQGEFILQAFQTQLDSVEFITQIRGQGLMIGIELSKPCDDLVSYALKQGILINVTSNNVIRLLPPLIIEHSETEKIVNIISTLIKEF